MTGLSADATAPFARLRYPYTTTTRTRFLPQLCIRIHLIYKILSFGDSKCSPLPYMCFLCPAMFSEADICFSKVTDLSL